MGSANDSATKERHQKSMAFRRNGAKPRRATKQDWEHHRLQEIRLEFQAVALVRSAWQKWLVNGEIAVMSFYPKGYDNAGRSGFIFRQISLKIRGILGFLRDRRSPPPNRWKKLLSRPILGAFRPPTSSLNLHQNFGDNASPDPLAQALKKVVVQVTNMGRPRRVGHDQREGAVVQAVRTHMLRQRRTDHVDPSGEYQPQAVGGSHPQSTGQLA
jgi:hypothetical protein